MDAAARRVTYFLGSEVVRTQAYPAVPMGPGENLAALYPLAKGEYLGVLANTLSTGDPAGMRPFPLLRIDAAGVVKDTLALLRESYPLRVRHLTSRPVRISDRQWAASVEEHFQPASRSRLSRQDYLRALRRPPSFPPRQRFRHCQGPPVLVGQGGHPGRSGAEMGCPGR